MTVALGQFEDKGVIDTARGAGTVKDREGLEECANGLYGPARGGVRAALRQRDRPTEGADGRLTPLSSQAAWSG